MNNKLVPLKVSAIPSFLHYTSCVLLVCLCSMGLQAATALTDAAMSQPIKGLSKFNTVLIGQVRQDLKTSVTEQQLRQWSVANWQTRQFNLLGLYSDDDDLLRLERVSRLSNQTRQQLIDNNFLVAQIDAGTLVRLTLDHINLPGVEVGVENVKGIVVIEAKLNP